MLAQMQKGETTPATPSSSKTKEDVREVIIIDDDDDSDEKDENVQDTERQCTSCEKENLS